MIFEKMCSENQISLKFVTDGPIGIKLTLVQVLAYRLLGAKPWASCKIRKIAGCACVGNAANAFPATKG